MFLFNCENNYNLLDREVSLSDIENINLLLCLLAKEILCCVY